MCTSVYSVFVIMCVYACVYVCVTSQSPLFHKVYIYLLFKSDCAACISYLMWDRVQCSHGSMWYCEPPKVCSGLGDCEETSGGRSCGVYMGAQAVC